MERRTPSSARTKNPRRSRIRPPPGRSPDPHLRRLRHPDKAIPGLTGVWTSQESGNALVGTAASAVQRSEASKPDISTRKGTDFSRADTDRYKEPASATEVPARGQARRHRHPHLPFSHLPRLRPQREHRPQLLQPDHPLRHHGKASHVDATRTRQAARPECGRRIHLPSTSAQCSPARCCGSKRWTRCLAAQLGFP